MKRQALFIICLVLVHTTSGWAQGVSSSSILQSEESKQFFAEWRLRLAGSDIRDDQSQQKIIDLRTDLQTKYYLSTSMILEIHPSLRLQSGQSQSIDGADRTENKVLLGQAALHILPSSNSRVSIGALNQRYSHNSLLIDSIPFPSLRGEVLFKSAFTTFGLLAESAVPTSTSLSTNTKELEPTPSLNSISMYLKSAKRALINWKTTMGYFTFNNIPSSVAEKSRLLGNEVSKISDAQYLFSYQYEGLEASAIADFPVNSSINLEVGSELLINSKAPEEFNKAFTLQAHGKFHINKNNDLLVGGSYFYVGPEATISYFNSGGFETNRNGFSTDGTLSFIKEGYSVGFKYIESDAIYLNSTQSRQKTYLLKLETSYAKI